MRGLDYYFESWDIKKIRFTERKCIISFSINSTNMTEILTQGTYLLSIVSEFLLSKPRVRFTETNIAF